MLSTEAVKRLINTPEWKALQRHIEAALGELDSNAGIDYRDKEAAAIEGMGRQLAIQKLTKILEPFVGFNLDRDDQTILEEKAKDAGLD